MPRIFKMGFAMFRVRRLIYLAVIALLLVLLKILISRTGDIIINRNEQLFLIQRAIHNQMAQRLGENKIGCKRPRLEVFAKDIMKHVNESPKIRCNSQEDWVSIKGSTAKITDEAKKKHGDIECSFTDILRHNDYTNHPGLTTTTHTEYNLDQSDFVRVRCVSPDSGKTWSTILAGVRHDQDVLDRTGWNYLSQDSFKLNVLMFGFDSLSHNTFLRKLPKSAAVLKNKLHAIVMEGYNIVGDGTPQALIPILTGKTELELPDTRHRMGKKASYCNIYPFIWNDFKEAGYVTAFMEDTPRTGIFTYRLKGFKEVPVDHYMRTYYVEAEEDFRKFNDHCLGSVPRHQIMMNYASSLMQVYKEKPKFIFGFHGELSHDDYNLIGGADDDIAAWLTSLQTDGYLNNTLLIIMSDHGHRFASLRNTQQGKLEERLPWFSFVLPEWFKTIYPGAYAALKSNIDKLTTPFDIYSTLKSVLHYPGNHRNSNLVDLRNSKSLFAPRSISLFHPIPIERTCADAFIEPHWCACLEWEPISTSKTIVNRLANNFVHFINKYNRDSSTLCSVLSLHSINWAAKLLPSEALRRFFKNADVDGFSPQMSSDLKITLVYYQIKVTVLPSNGIYEFSATHDITSDSFSFRIEDVSRINEYGAQARCIEKTAEHLRKFCHCKD